MGGGTIDREKKEERKSAAFLAPDIGKETVGNR